MSIENNTFCWTGITTDIHSAKGFYAAVLGWNMVDSPDGTVCIAPGGAVAHLQAPGEGPNSWCTFLAVDDLDARTARAGEQGSILIPPTALTAGRFSVVSTPSGAVFALYDATEADELAKPGPGSLQWLELQSTDPKADLSWMASVFGFTHSTQQAPQGLYHTLEAQGSVRGGVTASQSGQSFFFSRVQVQDVDATLDQVTEHGGQILSAAVSTPSHGRMATVSDPSGAVFGLIQPS